MSPEMDIDLFANTDTIVPLMFRRYLNFKDTFRIPDNITKISAFAFADSDLGGTLRLPKNLQYINEQAFANCQITSVEIPDSVSRICAKAFVSCKSLKDVILPINLVWLGDDAFYNTAVTHFYVNTDDRDKLWPSGLTVSTDKYIDFDIIFNITGEVLGKLG